MEQKNKSLNNTPDLKMRVFLFVVIVMFTCISIVQYLHFTELLNQAQAEINLQHGQIQELKKLLEISQGNKKKKIDMEKVYLFLKVLAVVTLTIGGGLGIYKLMSGALITPFLSDVTNMLSGLNEGLKVKLGVGQVEMFEPLSNGMNTVIVFSNRMARVFIELKPGELISLDDILFNNTYALKMLIDKAEIKAVTSSDLWTKPLDSNITLGMYHTITRADLEMYDTITRSDIINLARSITTTTVDMW